MFRDRFQAGWLLVDKLLALADRPNVLVLALPRGGVPVAFEIARAMEAPLDVYVVRRRDQNAAHYRGGRHAHDLQDRAIILVDDYASTGCTLRAAVTGILEHNPDRLVLAVPVTLAKAYQALRGEVDDFACLATLDGGEPQASYRDASVPSDDEVRDLLALSEEITTGEDMLAP